MPDSPAEDTLTPFWIRSAPVAGGALLALGAGIVVEQISTVWVDAVASSTPWTNKGGFYLGLALLFTGLVWCIAANGRKTLSDKPTFEAILARLGFALVVAGLLNFIALFGLASRDLLVAVVRPTETVAAAEAAAAKPPAGKGAKPASDQEELPPGLEYILKSKEPEEAKAPKDSAGRNRVIWAARMSLLPAFAMLGSIFFVCGRLQGKRTENEEELDDKTYSPERFWSGFWYRMGEGILFALVAFLASYAGFLDGVGEESWSGLLLLLGLLMAMFVKPAEQLVNGLAEQLFAAVITFTKRTLKDGPGEKVVDPLTPVIQRLNDSLESVRLQAVRELEQLAKTRYEDVVDTLAAFLRQHAGKPKADVTEDVQRAFVALGTIKPSRGKPRKAVSLRKAMLLGVRGPSDGLDLTAFDLSEANLTSADLSKANLSGTKLTGTQLDDVNLAGANLREAIDLPKAKLDGARYDASTSFPDGFDAKAKAMIAREQSP